MKLGLPLPWVIVFTRGVQGRQMYRLHVTEEQKDMAVQCFDAMVAQWRTLGCSDFRLVNLNAVNFPVEAVADLPADALPTRREDSR